MNNVNKNIFVITTIKIFQGNSAASARLMNISKALASEGVNVYLCSSKLKRNIWHQDEIYRNIFLIGEEDNLKQTFVSKFVWRYFNLLRQFCYVTKIYRVAQRVVGEKIYYLYPSIELSMDISAIICLKIFHRRKLFCDINELRVTALNNFVFSRNILRAIYEIAKYGFDFLKYKFHERLTVYYDGLVVISTALEKYFNKYNGNLLRVPILADTRDIKITKKLVYDKKSKLRLGFTGQISLKKEGFNIFYDAISIVKKNGYGIVLNLYGPINNNERKILLKELPLKFGIEDCLFYHGTVEQQYLISELKNNDLLVLPRPLHPQTHYGFSTKLSEYLVSGVPILVTDVGDNHFFIKDGYNGFIVSPGNAEIMAQKIIYIIDNYNDIANELVLNAYDTAKNEFDYSNYKTRLNKFLV